MREHPAVLPPVAVIAKLRAIAVGVGDAGALAVQIVAVADMVLLERRPVGALLGGKLVGRVMDQPRDPIGTNCSGNWSARGK